MHGHKFYFFIFIVYKTLVAYLMNKRNLDVSNRVIRYRPQNSFCMFIICKQGLWHFLFALAKHTGESYFSN